MSNGGFFTSKMACDNGHNMLVVDTKTSQTHIQGYDVVNGQRRVVSNAVSTQGWTNTLPGRLVPPEAQKPEQPRPARPDQH